jgi:uncharacterized protein (TIGR00299 family) protein
MVLGALIDAGAPLEDVRRALESLDVDGATLEISETQRAGLRAAQATVTVDHDRAQRSYSDIEDTLERTALAPDVRALAQRAFATLARAEAHVHGVDLRDVHLHEAGSLDALIDVVGSCAALCALRPERVVASAVATGIGSTESAHGTLPLPAPAVVEILKACGAPVFSRGPVELVTPTGAALLAAFVDDFSGMPAMRIDASGYGAGDRDLPHPNVLRAFLGRTRDATPVDDACVLECNLDDMTPELIAHVLEVLMRAGAQDAWVTPIVMKKGRPAFKLSILAAPQSVEALSTVVFRETTTLGLRRAHVIKETLERRWIDVDVAGRPVRVKLGLRVGEIVTIAPEHDDAVAAARAAGLALKDVYAAALRGAEEAAPKPATP